MNKYGIQNILNIKFYSHEDVLEECEALRESFLRKELTLMEMKSRTTGRIHDKVELARFHVEIAMRQMMHILYPELDPSVTVSDTQEE